MGQSSASFHPGNIGRVGRGAHGIVLLARKAEWEDERLQGVASGLLGMGILEGFHAVSSPDHGFVLLRSVPVSSEAWPSCLYGIRRGCSGSGPESWCPTSSSAGRSPSACSSSPCRPTAPIHGTGPIRADGPRGERCRRRLVPGRRSGVSLEAGRTGRRNISFWPRWASCSAWPN